MEIFVKLLIVHLVADFTLQWPAMLKSKDKNKFLSPYLYLHGLIHAVLSVLILWDVQWLSTIAVICVSHVVIDGLKLTLTNPKNDRMLFFLDQLLHVGIIFIAWQYHRGFAEMNALNLKIILLHTLFLILLTYPTSISIQKIFMKWTLPESAVESLVGMGVYIGFIERILIYIAIVSNHWSLVGFLIATKSIFRFGDYSNRDNRQYAEYIFIGTLLSLITAIVSGLAFIEMKGWA